MRLPMYCSKETKVINSICILFVLMAGAVRMWTKKTELFGCNNLILVFFTAAIFLWGCQLKKRLLQPQVRRYLLVTAGMMIVWIAVRSVKYDILPGQHFTVRYAWYLFYIPFVYIPLLLFLSVVYIGKTHGEKISRCWNLLYIPAAVLVMGVLTNDAHQLAFFFPEGLGKWDEDYQYGPLYLAVIVWIALLFVAMISVVCFRCAVPENRKKIWIPMLPFFFGVLYTILYIWDIFNVRAQVLKLPEIACFLFGSFMEALIITHLIPSNDNYSDFWKVSSIGAGIMGEDGSVPYESTQSIPVNQTQVEEAETGAVFLENGNVSLQSHRIQGGYCYWLRDISEIHQLNQSLENLGNVLKEENAMLEAENKMAEEKIKIRQQNAIYDAISNKVISQLEKVNQILEEPMSDDAEFEKKMKVACILNAYVKRCSNLVILSHQREEIDSNELCLALSESLDYLELYGVKTHGGFRGKCGLSGEMVQFVYEVFEEALEQAVPGADAMLLNLDIREKMLVLQMEINAPGKWLSTDKFHAEVEKFGGELKMEREEQTEFIYLQLATGGEAI